MNPRKGRVMGFYCKNGFLPMPALLPGQGTERKENKY